MTERLVFLNNILDFCTKEGIPVAYPKPYSLQEIKQTDYLDLLIYHRNTPSIINWIKQAHTYIVTKQLKDSEGESIFLAHANSPDTSLWRINLVTCLCLKGIRYLSLDAVFRRAELVGNIFIPNEIDSALIQVMRYRLDRKSHGPYWNKETNIVFQRNDTVMSYTLMQLFGDDYGLELADLIKQDKLEKKKSSRTVRRFVIHSLITDPVTSFYGLIRHYFFRFYAWILARNEML